MRVRYVGEVDGPESALAALESHVYRAQDELRRHRLPPLYRSGVKYQRAPMESRWRTPRQVLRLGYGHCPDLAAWRVAELRESGEDPDATITIRHGGRQGLWHLVVRRGDDTLEDPSAVLGMRGEG